MLVSTDVLSEGLNLQDATRMINYDIHWNPVRLMQRIGRVDRRMSPDVEERLKADHPEAAGDRGTVVFWNFLPPDELNAILSLYAQVTQKTLLISRTMGIEGKKLLTPEDDYEALKEFNQAYEGTASAVEEMHLEYQGLLDEIAGLRRRARAAAAGDLQRQGASEERFARGVLLLCAACPRQGDRGVHRGGRDNPLVLLRRRARGDPRGACRDRGVDSLDARHAAGSRRRRNPTSSPCARRC